MKISEYKKHLKEQINEQAVKQNDRLLKIKIDSKEFKELFLLNAEMIIKRRNLNSEFIIDKENRNIINQLFYYATDNEKFTGDLRKGILLIGDVGTGKTVILESVINIIENINDKNRRIKKTHALTLFNEINKIGYDRMLKISLLVDDLGKEPAMANNYGTKQGVVSDLLSMRYEQGAITYATANYTKESLISRYGDAVVSRFNEMFNILILNGKDRRKL